MLQETEILCPFCDTEIKVKFLAAGNKISYVVPSDCVACKNSASKIETALNRSGKGQRWRVEKSYLKTDPRG